MKKIIALLALIALISGCASATRYYKPGMTDAQFKNDSYDCHTIANQNARNQYGDNLNAFGVILESNAVNGEYRRCMEQKFGYAFINSRCTEVFNRGLADINQGNFTQAISDFTKAIELNPNYAYAYSNRGFAYVKLNDFTKAITDYTKAIEIDPNFGNAYCKRGLLSAEQGNSTQAISDYTKAIEINSNDTYAYACRATSYYMMKEYDKAWVDVHKAEGLGFTMPSDLIKELKKASGREK